MITWKVDNGFFVFQGRFEMKFVKIGLLNFFL